MRHARKFAVTGCLVLLCLIVCRAFSALSSYQDLAVFEAPGSGTDSAQGTSAQCINDEGEIAGQYIDGEGVAHGFLRHKNGTFITFDALGASKASDAGTFPRSISKYGEVVGYFVSDPNGVRHGFLRHKDGSLTTLDPPGSVSTVVQSINEKGEATGNYVADDAAHAFLLRTDGTFLTFDPPGSYNTAPQAINGSGEITGSYEDVIGVLRGFLRHSDGSFDTFSVPSASREKGEGTYPISLNDQGDIAGYYNSGPSQATHGFLRRKDGTILTFQPPGSITDAAAHQDEEGYLVRPVTAPMGINDKGEIVGYYGDATGVLHGFERSQSGGFRTLDAPHSSKYSSLGTSLMAINNAGEIAGYYYTDPDETLRGFISKPSTHALPTSGQPQKSR